MRLSIAQRFGTTAPRGGASPLQPNGSQKCLVPLRSSCANRQTFSLVLLRSPRARLAGYGGLRPLRGTGRVRFFTSPGLCDSPSLPCYTAPLLACHFPNALCSANKCKQEKIRWKGDKKMFEDIFGDELEVIEFVSDSKDHRYEKNLYVVSYRKGCSSSFDCEEGVEHFYNQKEAMKRCAFFHRCGYSSSVKQYRL